MTLVFKEVENFITKRYEWFNYYIDIDIIGTETYEVWITKKNEGNKYYYMVIHQNDYESYDSFLTLIKSLIIDMIETCEEDTLIYEKGLQKE